MVSYWVGHAYLCIGPEDLYPEHGCIGMHSEAHHCALHYTCGALGLPVAKLRALYIVSGAVGHQSKAAAP